MHSLISLPFHTADWAVLFSVMEIIGVVLDLCGLKIALLGRSTYNLLGNHGIPNRKVICQSVHLFSLCKASRQNVDFLIRLDCTSYTYNHGCYSNSGAVVAKESLSCHPKADSKIILK